MNGSEIAKSEVPQSQVGEQLANLMRQIGRIDNLEAEMEKRLESVVRVEPMEEDKTQPEQAMMVPLADQLHTASNVLLRIADRLVHILRCVEL